MLSTLHSYNTLLLRKSRQNCVSWSRYYSIGKNILEWDTSSKHVTPEIKHKIEKKWHEHINQTKFNEHDRRPKAYILSMFPYPSGALHMGHVRVYTISDTMARFYRMKGYNVLHPMGWDAFGLPAENAALEHGEEPAVWTESNIKQMREQLCQLGCSFDWDHEISTCHPSYYKWTQYIFLLMFKAGLVYRKPALVNWDPIDKTVLADEQIDENGNSWRSGAKVEKVLLTQWFIKSTKFAKSLSEGLTTLSKKDWSDIIKLQNAWIGDVNGFLIEWAISCADKELVLPVWTMTPENIDKVTFIAVTPGSLLDTAEKGSEWIEHIYADCTNKTVKVRHLKALATNPITGEKVPVFAVDGLLPFSKGSEAYMGTPSLVVADKIFANLVGIADTPKNVMSRLQSGIDARERVCMEAQRLGCGGYASSSVLKDWLISRQRYWGTPIPIIHCVGCGMVPVPEKQLPVPLPPFPKHRSSTSLGSPLQDATSWLHTSCPKCGGPATRETDTMDTFVDSSWYYLRYTDTKNDNAPFCPEKVKKFMPVDIYIGGKEHAVLHMYFARLMSHFLHEKGLLSSPEPFKRLLVQGMVMGQSYRDSETGQYLKQDEVNFSGEKPCSLLSGKHVIVEWEKMSKSKYNGIDPAHVIHLHGIDTTRLQMLADVAPTSNRLWSLDGFQSTLNLQNLLYQIVSNFISVRKDAAKGLFDNNFTDESFTECEKRAWLARNQLLSVATFNYEVSYQLMVVLTRIRAFLEDLKTMPKYAVAYGPNFERALATLLIVLAPMAPHFTSELWEGCVSAPGRTKDNLSLINWDKPLLEQSWPDVDGDFEIPVIVSVNHSEVCTEYIQHEKLEAMDENQVMQAVLHNEIVKKCLGGVLPTAPRLIKTSGYRAKISLKATGVKINPLDVDPKTKTAKKALSKLKRKEKKSQSLS